MIGQQLKDIKMQEQTQLYLDLLQYRTKINNYVEAEKNYASLLYPELSEEISKLCSRLQLTERALDVLAEEVEKIFTQEELKQMNIFYSSDVGQMLISKQEPLMNAISKSLLSVVDTLKEDFLEAFKEMSRESFEKDTKYN